MWTHPQSGRQLLHVKCGITSARHSGGCCGSSSGAAALLVPRRTRARSLLLRLRPPQSERTGTSGVHTRGTRHPPLTHAGKIWPTQQLCNSPTHPLRAYPVRRPPDTCCKSLCCLLQRSRVAPKQGVPRMHHHLTPTLNGPRPRRYSNPPEKTACSPNSASALRHRERCRALGRSTSSHAHVAIRRL